MKAAILSVGTELLFGQITNTNTVYLSQQMNIMGFDVMYHYTVGDNPGRVEDMINLAFEDCDLILTTGGLGPTQDDLTKEVACKVMDDRLVMMEDVLEEIVKYFKTLGREMTENNKKQAVMPSRATVFHNDAGTAPGFALEKNGKYIICMPGPPREMTRMFQKSVLPFLQAMSEDVIYYRVARMFGIGESMLETKLLDLIDHQTDPTLATYAKEGECSLRVASKRHTAQEAKEAVDEVMKTVNERLGEYIYSFDDEELVQVVCKKLMDKGLTISSAESCTGGLFAKSVTDIPGISKCFDRGIVTYSNRAKMEGLGVKEETLEKYGAVSEKTALEMAEGLKRLSGSDICISVTGIAGPGGGTEEKPVGLVYIGFIYGDVELCKKVQMRNVNRKWNRHYALLSMLDVINKNI
ncbi:MAG TPA: competence/damage-inducible protein A [Candidatus Copromorpha excrementigallinarum]|uniref:Putative competence-damage inducible protein n=1 Tax=Candidatus Allocopromorpha excrementigallinarum TaxID=2840742 RepID=A0A9D1I1I0_9FIRM|nr:competence/damage-inducible protein A [Candidatus Copromorpha excrementigallinarum]